MVVENQSISFRNVFSKFYVYESEETEAIFSDFLSDIANHELTASGPIFFSIISELEEEPIASTFYLPVEETTVEGFVRSEEEEQIEFSSYFIIENMIMTRVEIEKVTDYKNISVKKYRELVKYTEKNKLELTTHFFHMIKVLENKNYLEIYIGVQRKEDLGFFKRIMKKINMFS